VDETLIIEKLGPIRKLEIKPRRLTLIIGEQASGKSLVAQLVYFFRGFESHLARVYSLGAQDTPGWHTDAVRRILDGLRGLSLSHFCNSGEAASINYRFSGRVEIDWQVELDDAGTIKLSDSLIDAMDTRAKLWTSDKVLWGMEREGHQVFIPTDRSMFSRLAENEQSVLYADYQPEPFRRFADLLQRAASKYKMLYLGYPSSKEPSVFLESNEQLKKDKDFISQCQKKALAGEVVVPDEGLGPPRWMFAIETAKDQASSSAKLLPLQATASGQMEAWPFFALALTIRARGDVSLGFYFEEPETHLHPQAQVEVMNVVAYLVNREHRFVVTTHSPFTAYVVDNMMQRFISYKGEIPEGQVALNPDDVAAYRLRQNPDEPPEDIMDREDTKLLKLDELERVADELEAEFDELLEKAEWVP